MDHINSYFSKIAGTILKKGQEKEAIIFSIKEVTGIEIKKHDFVFKNHVLKIKLFGIKRFKIISFKEKIISVLKEKDIIVTDFQ